MNIQDLPPATPEQIAQATEEAVFLLASEDGQARVNLQDLLRIHIMAIYGWNLPDDPHGYAAEYDEALIKLASAFGVTLPPSPNM